MAERNYNIALTASDGFSGAFSKLQGAIGSTETAASRLRGVMGTLGVTLSAGLFANAVVGIANAADRLDDLAKKTGASVEELSKFAGVARITGQDLGAVESAMAKMAKSIVEAQDGTSAAAQAFKAFGISIRDAQGGLKTSGAVMEELAHKQQDFADGSGKVAALMALTGRSAAELIPYLNDYVKFSDQVAITTAAEAEAAGDFNDQLGLLNESFNKLLRDAILPLLPQMREVIRSFEELGTAIANLMPSGRGPLEGLLASIKETNVQTLGEIAYLRQAWENFVDWWKNKPVTIPPAAARDAAILAERNRTLAAATRELPPLMESTAKATGGAGLAFGGAGEKAKYATIHFDEMLRIGKELKDEFAESKKFWDDIAKAQEDAAKAAGSYAAAQADAMEQDASAREESIRNIFEQVNALEREVTQLELSNLERERSADLLALESSGLDINSDAYKDLAARINEAYDAKQRFGDNQDTLRANADAAKAAADEWKRTADSISDSLTDALLRGFESGKDFAKNLRDTLVNMFKTLVLRPMIQAVLGPVAGGISGLFPGSAGASSGAGSILGGGDWLSGIGSIFSGGGGALSAGLSTFAGNAALGFGASASTALGIAGFASMIGTALPFIGAGLAIAQALGLFDRGGPKTGGSASATADLGLGTVSAGGLDRLFTPDQRDQAMQTIATQVANDYMSVARSLGLSTGSASFGFGFDTDPEGTAGNRVSSRATINGQQVYGVTDRDLGRDGDINAALAEEASRALLAALKASSLPEYLANLFDTLDTETATPDQINALVQTAAALRIAVDAMAGMGDQFAAMDPADVREFVESFGGLQGFMERFVYIADNFYTDTQKLEKATAALAAGFADLGIVVPDTHQAFLDLLNGLDLTTEEGRAMYEAISALAPLFVQVSGTAQQAADALDQAAGALEDVAAAAANIVDLRIVASAVEREFARIMGNIAGLVSGSSGDFGEQLALQIRLTASEIARVTQSLAYATPGEAEWQAIMELLDRLRNANTSAAGELARFTILAAQYDAGRAAELVQLERWYAEQQFLFRNNADALAALRDLFNDRWKEIVDGVAGGVDGTLEELERLRKSLREYLAGLSLRNDLSPLSPAAKLAEAQRQYQELLIKAQGGDVDALREIQGAADAYLRLAREMFASGGSYTSIWQQVVDALGALANPPQTGGLEPNPTALIADALPVGSPLASQADVEHMAMAIIAAVREGSKEQATATAQAATITADAARPRR